MHENTRSLLAMMLAAAEEARVANVEADAEVEKVKERDKASEKKRSEAMDALVEARKRLAAEETEVRTVRKMLAVSKETNIKSKSCQSRSRSRTRNGKRSGFS